MDPKYQLETFQLERDHWWYRARHRIILSAFRRRFGHRDGLRILEIGCGAGTILNSLAQYGEAIGIDANPEAVHAAQRMTNCQVRLGRIPDAVPADLGRFDVVCLFDVIEHLDDDVAALRSARALMTPRGCLLVTVPSLPWIFGIHDEINEHRRRYTAGSLTAVLRKAGFTGTTTSYFNLALSPLLIPAIAWRNAQRKGHHFEIRSRWSPVMERLFGLERLLIGRVRIPFGLSLMATAQTGLRHRKSHQMDSERPSADKKVTNVER